MASASPPHSPQRLQRYMQGYRRMLKDDFPALTDYQMNGLLAMWNAENGKPSGSAAMMADALPKDREIQAVTYMKTAHLFPAHTNSKQGTTTLIVVNNLDEIRKYTALLREGPHPAHVIRFHGTSRPYWRLQSKDHLVALTTYSTLAAGGADDDRQTYSINSLFSLKWTRIIFFHSETLRNTGSKRSQACADLRADFRWSFSDALVVNKEEDLTVQRKAGRSLSGTVGPVIGRAAEPSTSGPTAKAHIAKIMVELSEQENEAYMQRHWADTGNSLASKTRKYASMPTVNKPAKLGLMHNIFKKCSEGRTILCSEFIATRDALEAIPRDAGVSFTHDPELFAKDTDYKVLILPIRTELQDIKFTDVKHIFYAEPYWNVSRHNKIMESLVAEEGDKAIPAYAFITKGTVEERIANLQDEKKEKVRAVTKRINRESQQLVETVINAFPVPKTVSVTA
ncbi:hypothetical protein RI367_005129 [Sorochytrium milnesiophthora]